LVGEKQPVALQGAIEVADQGQALRRVLVGLGRVDLVTAFGAFRDVHSDVSALHQAVGIRAVFREEREPDAGPHVEGELAQHDLVGEDRQQAFGEPNRLGSILHRRKEDRELIAAESGHQPLAADRSESFRHGDQYQVAVMVPERVIDLLETIKIHDHDRAAGARDRDRVTYALVEEGAIREQRQGIVLGRVLALGRLRLEFVGLTPEPPRGLRHDAKEEQVEEQQSQPEDTEHGQVIANDGGGDGSVRHVDLECPIGPARGLEAQGDVHLQNPAEGDQVGIL